MEFNKSALVSLKAELLRKQDEVNKAKRESKNRIENFKPSSRFDSHSESDKHETQGAGPSKDRIVRDSEECEMLRKSKEALEKKSVMYEHLSRTSKADEGNFLVQFDKKKKEDMLTEHTKDTPQSEDESNKYESDSDEEWVDYVDCLGRTRRCHKSDFEEIKRQDEKLKESIDIPKPNTETITKTWLKEGECTEPEPEPELVGPDAFREQLRKQWEEKERELMNKDSVHYEDVLFNEARQHGVGYYALSGDDVERAKQQAELAASRKQTEKAQTQAAEARQRREEALQARVKAARARQRVRAGLPPEEEEEKPSVTSMLLDFIGKQKEASVENATEDMRKKREEKEKEAQRERENIVREWDLGKEGLKMPFTEMTQEQWVEKKRAERINEFAPTESLSSRAKSGNAKEFTEKGFFVDTQGTYGSKEHSNVDKPSTSGSKKKYYDPSVNITDDTFEPVAIENELSDEEDKKVIFGSRKKPKSKGAEIAPPTTFEYFGPTEKRYKPTEDLSANLNDAFAQGLKRLEEMKAKRIPK